MKLVDRAARRQPALDDRPSRVWLPVPTATATATATARRAAAVAEPAPRSIAITLGSQQADDLPRSLPRVLSQQDLRPGDRVTLDLCDLGSVHLTGLALLMTVLWRRVGTNGEVRLTGGTPGLRAQLTSVDITPAACRAAVYGTPPAPPNRCRPVPAPVPSGLVWPRPAPLLPQQRRPQDPLHERDGGWDTRLALSGEST